MEKKYGPIEAIYGTTELGHPFVAARDGKVESNTVFGKPEMSGITYVGFMMDAAGDFPVRSGDLEPNIELELGE